MSPLIDDRGEDPADFEDPEVVARQKEILGTDPNDPVFGQWPNGHGFPPVSILPNLGIITDEGKVVTSD